MKKFILLFAALLYAGLCHAQTVAPIGVALGGGGNLTIGASPISGGSAGNFLYTDGSLLQATGGITFNGTGQATIALGAVTTNLKALTITGTFNASGTTFDAPLFENITNTASNVNSKLADFQSGGSSVLAIYPGNANNSFGNVVMADNAALNWGSTAGAQITANGTTNMQFSPDGSVNAFSILVSGGVYYLNMGAHIFGWNSGALAAAPDTAISRDSAGVFDFGNGALHDTSATLQAAHANLNALANSATTSAVCYNTSTGALTYDGTVGTCTTSDERLKTFDGKLPDTLDKLIAIADSNKFGRFHWNDPKTGKGERIGVGAQTVEKYFPELVETGDDGYKSLSYASLIIPVIEALRELKAENDALKREIRAK